MARQPRTACFSSRSVPLILVLMVVPLDCSSALEDTSPTPPAPAILADYQQPAKVGDTLTFTCTKPGDVVWDLESNSNRLAFRGSLEADSTKYGIAVNGDTQTLTLRDVTLTDGDVYRCYTLFNTDYERFIVSVQVPPQTLFIDGPITAVNEDRFVTLRCRSVASKPAPDFSWTVLYTDGSSRRINNVFETQVSNPDGTVTKTSEVNEFAARQLYQARIFCNATINTTVINYDNSTYVDVDINLKPGDAYLSGFEPIPVQGNTARLTCHGTDAVPVSEIQWYWDGNQVNGRETMNTNPNGTIDISSSLEFEVQSHHNGNTFLCTVTNQVMREAEEAALRLERILVVHYAPIVTVDPTERMVWEGATTSLDCSVDANPAPSWSRWLHNGRPVVNDSRHSISDNTLQPVLTISALTSTDKGTYVCQSTNTIGTHTAQGIRVVVLHAPVCKPRQKHKFAAEVGDSVELTCYVEAYPSENMLFGWIYNGSTEVSNGIQDPREQDIAYSTHNYTVGSVGDYKQIQCRASNGLEMRQLCTLEILPPGPAVRPNDCTATNVTSSHVTIDCWEEFDGGSTPFYTLGMILGEQFIVVQNQSSLEFDLFTLAPGTLYSFQICASNAQFWQEEDCTAPFDVRTLEINETITVSPPVDSLRAMAPFIALGVVGGLLLIFIIAAIIGFAVAASRRNDSKDISQANNGNVEEPVLTPVVTEQHEMQERGTTDPASPDDAGVYKVVPAHADVVTHIDEVTGPASEPNPSDPPLYTEVNKPKPTDTDQGHDNQGFIAGPEENMGDPIYDKADGIVGVTSSVALEDIMAEPIPNNDTDRERIKSQASTESIEPDVPPKESNEGPTNKDDSGLQKEKDAQVDQRDDPPEATRAGPQGNSAEGSKGVESTADSDKGVEEGPRESDQPQNPLDTALNGQQQGSRVEEPATADKTISKDELPEHTPEVSKETTEEHGNRKPENDERTSIDQANADESSMTPAPEATRAANDASDNKDGSGESSTQPSDQAKDNETSQNKEVTDKGPAQETETNDKSETSKP